MEFTIFDNNETVSPEIINPIAITKGEILQHLILLFATDSEKEEKNIKVAMLLNETWYEAPPIEKIDIVTEALWIDIETKMIKVGHKDLNLCGVALLTKDNKTLKAFTYSPCYATWKIGERVKVCFTWHIPLH